MCLVYFIWEHPKLRICFDAGESIKHLHTLFCFAMISIKKLVRTLSTFGTKMDENSGTTSEG